MKYKKIKIEDDMFRHNLELYIGDAVAVKNHLLKTGIPDDDLKDIEKIGGAFLSGDNFKIIFLPKMSVEELIHEIIHYVFAVLDNTGVPINCDNDEVFAYFVGYILNKIIQKTPIF